MDREFRNFVLHFLSYANANFKTHEIGENVANFMDNHIDGLFYNVVSLASTMALVYNSKKVEPKHVLAIHEKYRNVCSGGQNGGAVMPLQYFSPNAPSTMSAANFGGMDSRTINFAGNEARSGIDVSAPGAAFVGGGSVKEFRDQNAKTVAKFVRSVLKLQNMTASKHAMHDLVQVIFYHLSCLASDIQKKPYVNVPILQKMLKLKRHAIFH
jgi:hypothetical protein